MSIKRFLSGAIYLLMLVTLALGGTIALQQYSRMSALNVTAARLDVLKAASNILSSIAPERGITTLLLQSLPPGATNSNTEFAAARSKADDAFELARSKASALIGLAEDADQIKSQIEDIIQSWQRTRVHINEEFQRTPLERRQTSVDFMVAQSSSLHAMLEVLMQNQSRLMAEQSGSIFRFAELADAAVQMRDTAGLHSTALINLVTTRKPAAEAAIAANRILEGKLLQQWARFIGLANGELVPGRVRDAILTVKAQYYGPFQQTVANVIAAFPTGAYPYDGEQFKALDVAALRSLVSMRDAFFDAAKDEAATELDAAETALILALGLAALTLLLSVAISLSVTWRVIRPLAGLTASMRRIAAGDLGERIPSLGRGDELGEMAAAVAVFKDGLIHRDEAETITREHDAAEKRRRATLDGLVRGFEQSVGGIVGSVAQSGVDLEQSARQMSMAAQETSRLSTNVSSAAEEASANVTLVASSVEELSASVREIDRQVNQSAAASQAAVAEAKSAAGVISELSEAADKISEVLGLISTIAGQTNLLALNATIEAARAGEAGRGFAIVAAEVKELANQTAKATADISGQISAIQHSTDRAVTAIGGIAETIEHMNRGTMVVSSAISQQGTATAEIVRNITQAATGTSAVTANMSSVAMSARESGTVAGEVLSASAILSQQAAQLRQEVDQFLGLVRAA